MRQRGVSRSDLEKVSVSRQVMTDDELDNGGTDTVDEIGGRSRAARFLGGCRSKTGRVMHRNQV